MTNENKIPAFPVLEPLSKATEQSLAPLKLLETDFLEIDVGQTESTENHFILQAVCLKRCPTNILPSIDASLDPPYVQTPDGAFYKDDRHYNYPSYNAAITWYSRIPERRQRGYGKWEVAGTDYSALIIHHAWPHDRLIFRSEQAMLLYSYLLRRFYVQSSGAAKTAKFKLSAEVPAMPNDFVDHKTLPLTPYQKAALSVSLNNSAYALFMEQGTGKTAVVINRVCLEAARKRAKKDEMYRALIICPQQIRLNWQREFARFATSPGKTCILRGTKLSKIRTLTDGIRSEDDCAWSATILSIDSVVSIWEGLKNISWDLVVIDESHKIKNPSTRRFKSLLEIDDSHTKAKMVLTGTPITNTVFDLWGQFEWLGKGLSGFSTFPNFRAFHGRYGEAVGGGGGNGVRKLIGFKNVPLIQERLARMSFLIRKEDCGLDLPDKVYDIYEVSMVAAQAEIYKQIANKLVAEIDEMLAIADATGTSVTTECILTKMIRLAQVCSGFIKVDDQEDLDNDTVKPGAVFQISPKNPKIDALIDILQDDWDSDENSKCVVWACFIEDIRAISERLAKEGINHVGYHSTVQSAYRAASAAAAEDVINLDDTCRVLVANPASAGIGQNYLGYDRNNPDKSAMYVNHHIYFSSNWSSVDRIQSEDRSHRRGTRTNLRITDLVTGPSTIDTEIRDRVRDKRNMAMTIQDVRNILNNILRGYSSIRE